MGANPNLRGHFSPLHYASIKGSLNTFKLLLEKGADPNALEYSTTILHRLCKKHYLLPLDTKTAMAKLALEYGAAVDIKDESGKTALEKARKNLPGTPLLQLIEEYSKAKKIG